MAWISHGLLRPTGDDFAMLRLILLALLPQIGGVLLMVARWPQAPQPWLRFTAGYMSAKMRIGRYVPRSGEDPEVGKSREQLLADDDKDKAPSLRVILERWRPARESVPEELIHPSSK